VRGTDSFLCALLDLSHGGSERGSGWPGDLSKGKARIARALYVTAKERRVVIVRAFIKKTEKTPAGEIDVGLQRAREMKP
jgi:hypothetical protein